MERTKKGTKAVIFDLIDSTKKRLKTSKTSKPWRETKKVTKDPTNESNQQETSFHADHVISYVIDWDASVNVVQTFLLLVDSVLLALVTFSGSRFLYGLFAGIILCYYTFLSAVWLFRDHLMYSSHGNPAVWELTSRARSKTSSFIDCHFVSHHGGTARNSKTGWLSLSHSYKCTSFSQLKLRPVYILLKPRHAFVFRQQQQEEPAAPRPLAQSSDAGSSTEVPITFDSVATISLDRCSLELFPEDLPVRRIWGRKFPIALQVEAGGLQWLKCSIGIQDVMEEVAVLEQAQDVAMETNNAAEKLYLFACNGREKYDWYNVLTQLSKNASHPERMSSSRGDCCNEYHTYMQRILSNCSSLTSRAGQSRPVEESTVAVNMFIGRMLWDIFYYPPWTEWLRQRIDHRVGKFELPPFVKYIKVKELELGSELPTIKKVDSLFMDDYGMWIDLQLTYSGCVKLLIETQLNSEFYDNLIKTALSKEPVAMAHGIKLSVGSDPVKGGAAESRPSHIGRAQPSHEKSEGQGSLLDINGPLVGSPPEMEQEVMDLLHQNMQECDGLDDDSCSSDLADDATVDAQTQTFLDSRAGKKVVSMVGWIAQSRLVKMASERALFRRAYDKLYNKMHSMLITLEVEVRSLSGTVALNIPPPPSDRIWFNFRGKPEIQLIVRPKLGSRLITMTVLTEWIKRKLSEEFKKHFSLPMMHDLTLTFMNSGLNEVYACRPMS